MPAVRPDKCAVRDALTDLLLGDGPSVQHVDVHGRAWDNSVVRISDIPVAAIAMTTPAPLTLRVLVLVLVRYGRDHCDRRREQRNRMLHC